MHIPNFIASAAKAWFAAVATALAAALPAIQDATYTFVATVVAGVVGGAGTYLLRNRPKEG